MQIHPDADERWQAPTPPTPYPIDTKVRLRLSVPVRPPHDAKYAQPWRVEEHVVTTGRYGVVVTYAVRPWTRSGDANADRTMQVLAGEVTLWEETP